MASTAWSAGWSGACRGLLAVACSMAVAGAAAQARQMSPLGALPASFQGPSAPAEGPQTSASWHLDLLPHGRFQLRQRAPGGPAQDDLGAYSLEGSRLTLQGTAAAPLTLEHMNDGSLRLPSKEDLRLRRLPAARLIEPRLTLSGLFTRFADAPRIVLCADGRSLPVHMTGDYLALERAFQKSGVAAGAPLWVQLDAFIAVRPSMEESRPPEPTLVVERFGRVDPLARCTGPRAHRPLTGTDWRLVWLDGRAVPSAADEHAASLRLNAGRVTGSDGCNRLTGPAALDGASLRIGPLAGTRMACGEGRDSARAFLDALDRVQAHAIRGDVLELRDARGLTLLRFQARP